MGTDARSQAILAEIAGLSQPQSAPAVETAESAPGDRNEAILAEVRRGTNQAGPLSRADAVLSEVEGIAKTLPKSRSQAIVSEVEAIAARRMQPAISGGSFLEKSLDVLNAAQQAVFGIATREEGETTWQAAVRGMKENARFLDVMQRSFDADPASFSNRAVGLAGDILLDPMWLLAGPVFKAGAKVLKVTAGLVFV